MLADEVRVVFVTHGQPNDPYWEIIKNGMNDAAGKLGVTVEYHSPSTFSTAEMLRLIDAAVASRPDGLVVSMPDEEALSPAVLAATAAGIPVIVIDAGGPTLAKKVGALFFMGQSEFGAGLAAGRRAHERLARRPLCIDHEVGNVSLEARCHGFNNGLGVPAPVLQTTLDPIAARKQLALYLAEHPDTDFILTLGAASAEVALDVTADLPADARPGIGTFDLSPRVLDAISDGEILWGIDAQPFLMGYVPVMTFNLLKRYRLAPVTSDGFYQTGPSFIEQRDAKAMKLLSEASIR
ncbi:MAG: sugar ABC transporter substrate-binding protein [Rhodospirillaceae bacterium]|nr:sugar ABC transporter substrate-binding protein [Rhodospirillaceae bacterium]